MKRILSVLTALIIALSCITFTFAEGKEYNTVGTVATPSFSVSVLKDDTAFKLELTYDNTGKPDKIIAWNKIGKQERVLADLLTSLFEGDNTSVTNSGTFNGNSFYFSGRNSKETATPGERIYYSYVAYTEDNQSWKAFMFDISKPSVTDPIEGEYYYKIFNFDDRFMVTRLEKGTDYVLNVKTTNLFVVTPVVLPFTVDSSKPSGRYSMLQFSEGVLFYSNFSRAKNNENLDTTPRGFYTTDGDNFKTVSFPSGIATRFDTNKSVTFGSFVISNQNPVILMTGYVGGTKVTEGYVLNRTSNTFEKFADLPSKFDYWAIADGVFIVDLANNEMTAYRFTLMGNKTLSSSYNDADLLTLDYGIEEGIFLSKNYMYASRNGLQEISKFSYPNEFNRVDVEAIKSFGDDYIYVYMKDGTIYKGVMPFSASNGEPTEPISRQFSDVPETAWYAKYVEAVTKYGIMSGTSSKAFSPNTNLSRAMFVQILANLDNVNTSNKQVSTKFTDVKSGAWYAPAVKWANDYGIVSGTSDTTFSPNADVQRQQMCVMLSNYVAYKGIALAKLRTRKSFSDEKDIASYAKDAVYACQMAGLIDGMTETTFAPRASAKRCQVARIFTEFYNNYVK